MVGTLGAMSHHLSRKLDEAGGLQRVEACSSSMQKHPLAVTPFPDSGSKGVPVPSGAKDSGNNSVKGGAFLSHVQVRQDVEALENHCVFLCYVLNRVRNGL